MPRMFQMCVGPEVDLDDPATYSRLPQTVEEVRNALYREIGYAKVYVIAHGPPLDFGKQIDRIDAQVRDVATAIAERKKRSLAFWQEKLFLFLDEIENMC